MSDSTSIQDRRVVGVDRFDFGAERLGRFGPFAEGDPAADAGAEVVPDDQFVRLRLARSPQFASDSGTTSRSRPRRSSGDSD